MKKNCFINYAAGEYMKLLLCEIEKLHFHTEKEAVNYLNDLKYPWSIITIESYGRRIIKY